MIIHDTDFAGLKIIETKTLADDRGAFTKLFNADIFAAAGVTHSAPEIYVSTSHRGAVRGLHFQTPPYDHSKLVFCLQGELFDVCVDLRRSQPTYGRAFTRILNSTENFGLLVPAGFAHGVMAMSDNMLLLNATSTVYAPGSEGGIRWDSCGVTWPAIPPLLSPKDVTLPALADYTSPFA